MQLELFRSVIDQLLDHDSGVVGERIALHGLGEPLLASFLWDNLDYLDAKGFKNVDFSTNGLLLYPSVIERLLGYHCLSWIRVSVNSTRRELMELINTGTDFDRVVENSKDFLEANARVGYPLTVWIQLMKTPENEDETEEDFYRLFGRRDFVVRQKRLHSFLGQVEASELTRNGRHNCVFGGDALMVHWDGDLAGCCTDDTKSQVYGKVRDGIFSGKVQARRKQLDWELQEGDFRHLPLCRKCLSLCKDRSW